MLDRLKYSGTCTHAECYLEKDDTVLDLQVAVTVKEVVLSLPLYLDFIAFRAKSR